MGDTQNVTVASNVLGTIGTVLWCIQLVPQIWHNWKRKTTDGLPPAMMFLWASCAPPMGAYLILQKVNIPLQIQPQIFCALALVSWAQCLYYNHGYGRLKVSLVALGTGILFGGIEALLVLTLRIPYSKGITWPDLVVGVVAAILLAAGLLPPYFELWKRNGRVVGFNWIFLSIDTLGGLFSLFALGTFDILGGIMYLIVVVLEFGIYGSHIIWRIRHRDLRQAAKVAGKSIDEMLEESGHHDGEQSGDAKRKVASTRSGDLESQISTGSPQQRQEQPSVGDTPNPQVESCPIYVGGES